MVTILSQNEDILMETSELRYNQKEEQHSVLAYDTGGVYRVLGSYDSKERALYIIREIFNKQKNEPHTKLIYEMPKK